MICSGLVQCLGDRDRHPADPERVLLRTLLVFCSVKGRIGHIVDFFVGFQVYLEVLDDGSDCLLIGFIRASDAEVSGINMGTV